MAQIASVSNTPTRRPRAELVEAVQLGVGDLSPQHPEPDVLDEPPLGRGQRVVLGDEAAARLGALGEGVVEVGVVVDGDHEEPVKVVAAE